MPQPLSRFATTAQFSLNASQASNGRRVPIFQRHQKFSFLAMEVIAAWSQVETSIVMLFAYLSGGPAADAFAIYNALTAATAKNSAILALSARKFDSRDVTLFNAVRSFSKACEKQRNRIVHHTWGFFRERDDAVLLVDPRDLIGRSGPLDLSKVLVYTENDFVDLAQDCHELNICYHLLNDLRTPQRDEVYAILTQKPQIQSRMQAASSS